MKSRWVFLLVAVYVGLGGAGWGAPYKGSAAGEIGLTWRSGLKELIVATVAPSSAAASAKFAPGDVIQGIEGVRVAFSKEFDDRLSSFQGGSTIKISIHRKGKPMHLYLALSALSARESSPLTDRDLERRAIHQAEDPEVARRAERMLELSEKMHTLLSDSRSTYEEFREQLGEALKAAQEAGLTGSKTPLSLESEAEFKRGFEASRKIPASNLAADYANRKGLHEIHRLLMKASSRTAFIEYLSQCPDRESFPGPDKIVTMALGVPGLAVFVDASKFKGLPRQWSELTEAQYQQIRTSKLIPFTSAGQELVQRRISGVEPRKE